MLRAAIAETRAFESWQDYQEALKRAIAPLTEEQLQRRLMQSIWGLLDHDLPHAGELSLLLGADGMPGVEI